MKLGDFKQVDYQRDVSNKLREDYDKGYNRLLTKLFTGAGKTTGIAAFLPKYFPDLADLDGNEEGGLLFLSHRREILRHSKNTFERLWPNKLIGIEMGEYHATGMEDFIFVSVDSLGRLESNRIFKYTDRKFGIVVADEGHHVTEDGIWDNILNYFGVGSDESQHYKLKGNKKPLSLFMTATPKNELLAPFIDKVSSNLDIEYGIRNGWLTDIKMYFANCENCNNDVDYMMQALRQYAKGLRTLVFANSVADSASLVSSLNENRIVKAAHVDANTPKKERDVIFPKFESGEIKVLSNRLVVTEGYDNPNIQAILDHAESSTRTSFPQKVGRGLRTASDANVYAYDTPEERRKAIRTSSKPYLVYITTYDPSDHIPKLFNTNLETIDIKGVGEDEGVVIVEEIVDNIRLIEEEQPERDVRDIRNLEDLKITLKRADIWTRTIYNEELKAQTNLRWVLMGNEAALMLPENPNASSLYEKTPVIFYLQRKGRGIRLITVSEGGWVEELQHPVKPVIKHHKWYTSLHKAITVIDKWLKNKHPELYDSVLRNGFEKATTEQLAYLQRIGIKVAANITQDTASLLIEDYKIKRKLKIVNLL